MRDNFFERFSKRMKELQSQRNAILSSFEAYRETCKGTTNTEVVMDESVRVRLEEIASEIKQLEDVLDRETSSKSLLDYLKKNHPLMDGLFSCYNLSDLISNLGVKVEIPQEEAPRISQPSVLETKIVEDEEAEIAFLKSEYNASETDIRELLTQGYNIHQITTAYEVRDIAVGEARAYSPISNYPKHKDSMEKRAQGVFSLTKILKAMAERFPANSTDAEEILRFAHSKDGEEYFPGIKYLPSTFEGQEEEMQ